MRRAPFQLALAAACAVLLAGFCRADEPVATPAPSPVPAAAAPESTPEDSPVAPLPAEPEPIEDEKPLFSEADTVALAAYRLDDARLARFEAVIAAMDAQIKTDEAVRGEMEHDEAKTDGIENFVNSIEKEKPRLLALIKAAGMTPREFVMTSYSLTMAMVYADLLRVQPASPLPDFVVRENIVFVRKNEERLTKLFQSLNHD